MNNCQFCEREMPERKVGFCSQICRDAAKQSALPEPELESKWQTVNWIRLQKHKWPWNFGWMKKKHLHD